MKNQFDHLIVILLDFDTEKYDNLIFIDSERNAWCEKYIGEVNKDWDTSSPGATGLRYSFLREKDAIMFSLKWVDR